MYQKQKIVTSLNGDVILSVTEDQEDVAQAMTNVRESTKGWTPERTMKLMLSIPVQEYYHWEAELGQGIWNENDFRKWWNKYTEGKFSS